MYFISTVYCPSHCVQLFYVILHLFDCVSWERDTEKWRDDRCLFSVACKTFSHFSKGFSISLLLSQIQELVRDHVRGHKTFLKFHGLETTRNLCDHTRPYLDWASNLDSACEKPALALLLINYKTRYYMPLLHDWWWTRQKVQVFASQKPFPDENVTSIPMPI